MARVNIPHVGESVRTHEGAVAVRVGAELELRRSVMACMLWESTFYEEGVDVVKRISDLVPKVKPEKVAEIAVEARERMKLRHVPLLLVRELARQHYPVADVLSRVVQRPDEMAEFLALYWKDGRCPVAAQVKKGLARAFEKFNEYQISKYNRDDAIKLRDVLFISHAKPKDDAQAEMWKRLVNNELSAPDTWEVALSGGKDKRETWERLLVENKLGALALLRNLRNMRDVGVDEQAIFSALGRMKVERILPFRFIAAARYAPQWEDKLEPSMFRCLEGHEKLPGKTVLLIDVSGSMEHNLSTKSEMNRMDAACGIAILAREVCENVSIYSFSSDLAQIPSRRGFALRDAIVDSQYHGYTYLGRAVTAIDQREHYDRLIVFTDEQSHDTVPKPKSKGYMVNVASYKNGVGYGKWTHIDGFSEAVIDYILESERIVQ